MMSEVRTHKPLDVHDETGVGRLSRDFEGPIVRLEGVTKRLSHFMFGPVDMTLDLKPETVTAVVGANGSGKTVLLNMLVHWVKPTRGTVYMFGKRYSEAERWIKSHLAYVPDLQEMFYGLTVNDLVKQHQRFAPDWDRERFKQLANVFEVSSFDVPFEFLSKGNRERALLALMFSRRVPLYILDEPTNGLDIYVRARLYDIWRDMLESGASLLMVSHDVTLLERFADVLVMMHHGRVLGVYEKDELLERWARFIVEDDVPMQEGKDFASSSSVCLEEDRCTRTGMLHFEKGILPSIVSCDRVKTSVYLNERGYRFREHGMSLEEIIKALIEHAKENQQLSHSLKR